MAKLITSAADLRTADSADLIFTYNQLKGEAVKRFASRVVAERRVEAALMAARDADGHSGVAKGADPQPRTAAELAAKAAAKPGAQGSAGRDAKGSDSADAAAEPSFPPGSLADQLSKAAKKATPITARVRKAKAPKGEPGASAVMYAVQATGAGTTKLQERSIRASVFAAIDAQPNKLVTIAALRAHLSLDPRGHIQKLVAVGRVRPLSESEHTALVEQLSKKAA